MNINLKNRDIIKIAKNTLLKYDLCDHCLGRIFAQVEHGMTNQKRGGILRRNLNQSKKIKICNCWLCDGLFDELHHFSKLIMDSLKEYEFVTFLIGTKIDEDIQEKEQQLLDFTGNKYSEPIKTELNREIGKILEKKLYKEVDFKDPTIMAVIDTAFDVVDLQIKSLYVYGKYKKFSREIPQTKWYCRICNGKGCKNCDYKGQLYDSSVEELIAKNFLMETKGTSESFHGSGREDIDVRMIGSGRPFILEIKNPRIRNLNLKQLESDINSQNKNIIEVLKLRYSNKDEIIRLKKTPFKKKYKIILSGEKPINNEKLKKVAYSLRNSKISQLTPSRVAHRRADMVREKQIYNCEIESIDGAIATLIIEAESGTYIKELVTGDNKRTKPNISDMIGAPCNVKELDVIEIKGE